MHIGIYHWFVCYPLYPFRKKVGLVRRKTKTKDFKNRNDIRKKTMIIFHDKCITKSNLSSTLVAQESENNLKAPIFFFFFNICIGV